MQAQKILNQMAESHDLKRMQQVKEQFNINEKKRREIEIRSKTKLPLLTEIQKDEEDEVNYFNLKITPQNTAIDEIDLVNFETNPYEANRDKVQRQRSRIEDIEMTNANQQQYMRRQQKIENQITALQQHSRSISQEPYSKKSNLTKLFDNKNESKNVDISEISSPNDESSSEGLTKGGKRYERQIE